MLIQELKELFIRDLNKLKDELSFYSGVSNLYRIENEIKNSAGNLTLHLCGNLKHFIGATLNNTGYVRDRDKEFSNKKKFPSDLIVNVVETIDVVESYFDTVKEEDLSKPFPIKVFKEEMTTQQMLIHLYGHLNYHLGQINYHRRLLGANG